MTDEVKDVLVDDSSGTPAADGDQERIAPSSGLHRFEQAVEELETIARELKARQRRSRFRVV